MTAKAAQKTQNFVRGETNTLELARLGHAINLRVYRDGKMKGRLLVGQGSLAWIPRGKRQQQRKTIPWDVFAILMKEWPFGSPAGASIKFVNGALSWRAPHQRGGGRRVSWEELAVRMNLELTQEQRTKIAKAEKLHKKARRKTKTTTPKKDLKAAKGASPAAKSTKKKAVRKPRKEAPPPPAPAVRIPGIRQALGTMAHVEYPVSSREVVQLKHRRFKGRPRPIKVLINDSQVGQIDLRGFYRHASSDTREAKRLAQALKGFVANRQAWIDYTLGEGICVNCGRKLTAPKSVFLSMGPVCRKKLGIGGGMPARGNAHPKKSQAKGGTRGVRRHTSRRKPVRVH